MTKCKKCEKESNVTCLCGFCQVCINKYGHDNLFKEIYKEGVKK